MENQYITMRDHTKLKVGLVDNGADHWLVVTHGVSEHYRRHLYLKELFGKSLNYLFYDLRGHGESEGHPQYVDEFNFFAKDLGEIIQYLHDHHGMEQYILYGHSLGGLITSDFLKHEVKDELYPKLVYLSSPPVTAGGILGLIAAHAPMPLYHILVNLPLSIRYKVLAPNNLSHDQRVNDEAEVDPLGGDGMHTKLSFEAMKAARTVFSGPLNPKCPAYISIGTGDKIVSPEAAIHYFTKVETAFDLKIFYGAYHELFHEIDKFKVPYLKYLKSIIDDIL